MALSYSQIQLYRTCPKQYEYACVKKIPRAMSAGESFGSSVHNVLKRWGEMEMNMNAVDDQLSMFASDDPTPELNEETLVDLWHKHFIVHGYDSKTDVDAARARGESILRAYHAWWRENAREVVAVEKGFALPDDLGGITGRFDRLERDERGIHVIDYKTSAVRTKQAVDHDLQLSMYAIAVEHVFGVSCIDLTLLFMRPDGITPVITKRTEADLIAARERIASASEGIDAKLFDAIPSITACGRCPYSGICPASVA